jgi:hypothetical protein
MKYLPVVILLAACGTENHLTDRGFRPIEGNVECAEGACQANVVGPETCLAVVQLLTKNSAFVWRRIELKEGEPLTLAAQAPSVKEAFTLTADPISLRYRCY